MLFQEMCYTILTAYHKKETQGYTLGASGILVITKEKQNQDQEEYKRPTAESAFVETTAKTKSFRFHTLSLLNIGSHLTKSNPPCFSTP
jgi:hypothetical protein